MNAGVDAEKAKIYAEEGGDSLVDNDIAAKKNKLSQAMEDKFKGFANELTIFGRFSVQVANFFL